MKIKGLEELIKQNLQTKNEVILTLKKNLKKNQATLEKNLTTKDNRITQLSKTLEASKAIIQHQLDYLKNLTSRLEKEQDKNKDNQEYQTHLREDLKRLAQDSKDLTQSLTNLQAEEQKNKKLRDEEIIKLKKQIEEMEPKCLTDEELKILTALREFWFSNIYTNYTNDEVKFLAHVQTQTDKLRQVASARVFKTLGTVYCLWYHLVPGFFRIIDKYKTEKNNLNSQLSLWITIFPKENASQVQGRINNLQTQINTANAELTNLKVELDKEKKWLDRHIETNRPLVRIYNNVVEMFVPTDYGIGWYYEKVSNNDGVRSVLRTAREFYRKSRYNNYE